MPTFYLTDFASVFTACAGLIWSKKSSALLLPFFHSRGLNAVMPAPAVRRRFSIGEWYGQGFEKLAPATRVSLATREKSLTACSGDPCPFTGSACNKRGGVCTIRTFMEENSQVELVESPVAVCPNRFKENGLIYTWVGEVLLGTTHPIVLGEVGFLDRFRPPTPEPADSEETADFIGRIDNVLIHPETRPMDWCALEIQAVYFSGKSMGVEFTDIAASTGAIKFPKAHRRPDWRSSGPKRLLPQLQTKVPTIRTWGKKMAVIVDQPFFDQLIGLHPEPHLSNAEIIWFVVKYEPTPTGWRLCRDRVVYTSLANSVTVLTGGTPLSREAFETQLRQKLARQLPGHPLSSL